MSLQVVEGFEAGVGNVLANLISGSCDPRRSNTAGPWSLWAATNSVRLKLANGAPLEVYGSVRWYTSASISFQMEDINGNLSFLVQYTSGTGTLTVRDNTNTIIATGTTVLTANSWHQIEWHAKYGDVGTGLVQIKLDGLSALELDVSSIDTKNGTTGVGLAAILVNSGGPAYDDLIVVDTAGTKNNTWIGDFGLQARYPTAMGDKQEWDPLNLSVNRFYFP